MLELSLLPRWRLGWVAGAGEVLSLLGRCWRWGRANGGGRELAAASAGLELVLSALQATSEEVLLSPEPGKKSYTYRR